MGWFALPEAAYQSQIKFWSVLLLLMIAGSRISWIETTTHLEQAFQSSPLSFANFRPHSSSVTILGVIRSTWQEYGIRGFYRGISASYVGSVETAINFMVYENVKGALLSWGQRRSRLAESAADGDSESWDEYASGEGENSGRQYRGTQGGSKLNANRDMLLCMCASAFSKFFAISVAYPHGELIQVFLVNNLIPIHSS